METVKIDKSFEKFGTEEGRERAAEGCGQSGCLFKGEN